MTNKTMKTLTIGENTYEIFDETARKNIGALQQATIPDNTLSKAGFAADAKATGNAINQIMNDINTLVPEDIGALPDTYEPPVTSVGGKTGNVTLEQGEGIAVNGTTITNTGVRSVSTGTDNGTIVVNTNGSSASIPVHGLKSAAYTESSTYAQSVHTHSYFYTATLSASGWSSTAPYSQTVNVNGILETDNPFIDLDMSDASSNNAEDYQEAWMCIGRMVAQNGSIKAYCYTDKPEVNIKIIIKVVR